ncbi:MAG: PSD1 domain-containing protein [Bryobacterales bacterium]|nr:PSD1 domain-containing protein [Bryobacterales bacterium]
MLGRFSWVLGFLVFASILSAGEGDEFFEMKVRPLLAKNCLGCHAQTKMGGLSLTSREEALKGGKSGPAIKAGDPGQSLLIQAIRHTHGNLKMPPSGKMPEADIELLAHWVKDGAAWPSHKAEAKADGYRITAGQRAWWSFRPVKKPAPPAVKDKTWPKTGIDRFLLAAMDREGLKPVAEASRRTLLRRASFDLTGLPPTEAEVKAFTADKSPDAYDKVVDRLLASPRYGERWGRHWLDVARYADEKYSSTEDAPYPNAWRYRDWVIQAMNADMPYDRFLKAQIAGDLFDPQNKERYIGGLGFFSLSPEQQDDRVDALSRGLLGLTVACAQCHDHKFDPIPTKDYYSLLGVFRSTKLDTYPLAPAATVKEYDRRKAASDEQKKKLDEYLDGQASQLALILATRTARYLEAARGGAAGASLDAETLERLKTYLNQPKLEHPFLKDWKSAAFDDAAFQAKVAGVFEEKKRIDRENMIALGGKTDDTSVRVIEVKSLARDDFYLWRDFFQPSRVGKADSGVFYYKDAKLDRWLAPAYLGYANQLRAESERLKKAIPEMYPFYQTVSDVETPKDIRVEIKGNRDNLGEEAPRRFLSVLCDGEPPPFTKGSGRLELAEAIASSSNPLTARVMANRVWLEHFGRGLVGSPSNFGQLGEKPTNPELLDYLAARLMEQGWSLKALHREIVLSAAYRLSSQTAEPNMTKDPGNAMVWHWARRRLDAEPLRDTLLYVAGDLDETPGGKPEQIADASSRRRTVYGSVSRRKLDGTLALFDFPNPVATTEQRIQTATPLQQLFFLNSEFIQARAKALSARVSAAAPDDAGRIRAVYRVLFQREAARDEIQLGLKYLQTPGGTWPRYAQALLGSNELLFVN